MNVNWMYKAFPHASFMAFGSGLHHITPNLYLRVAKKIMEPESHFHFPASINFYMFKLGHQQNISEHGDIQLKQCFGDEWTVHGTG